MWKYLSGLPVELSFALIILMVIGIVIIALRGHLKAKFDKKAIEIGPDNAPQNSSETKLPSPAPIFQKRSCGDCILLLIGEREKFEIQIKQETNRILKSQMNFAEQKLLEIQNVVMRAVVEAIHKYAQKNQNAIHEVIQYKLIYGLFREAMLNIKDEMRRSFKDNGFYEMGSSDFMSFVKDRTAIIHSILDQYVRNMFPDHSGIIGSQDIIYIFEAEKEFLSAVFKDIYFYAKSVKTETEDRVKNIKKDFKQWIDEFISPNLTHERSPQ